MVPSATLLRPRRLVRAYRPGKGARRVEIRTVIDTDAETIDQLAAEPSCDERNGDGNGGNYDRRSSGSARRRPSQPPADSKESHDDNVSAAVKQTDALCARRAWNGEEVDQTESRRQQTGNDSCRDHIERSLLERRPARCDGDQIEEQRHAEHTEREHDEHLVNRMAKQLRARFHRSSSSARRTLQSAFRR